MSYVIIETDNVPETLENINDYFDNDYVVELNLVQEIKMDFIIRHIDQIDIEKLKTII